MSPFDQGVVYTHRFLDLLKLRGLESSEASESFLRADLDSLLDPFRMKGMREACLRIHTAVRNGEGILIHGDYDVDGITGASIVAKTLKLMGVEPRVFLPNRSEDGYGVSERAIREAKQNGESLLITVDCGVAAASKIALARDLGLDVIIVDHHRIPADGLPPANFILNPLQSDCDYPFKDLSAGGLAFKLSQALLGERAYEFLDLAAVSTVCDVAPLREENRVLVRKGLKLLTQKINLGFRALSEVAKLGSRDINVGHIGFAFGPRINAAGRMSSPEIALRLLLTQSPREAESLAKILEEENKARQREERQTVKEAIREVERTMNFSRDRVIVVGREGWHQGVIGIVASRLVDRFHRPAIVIAFEEGKGKGSGRSIKAFNLYEGLCDSKELFLEFGGHAQAAGLSIMADKIDAFRIKINEFARSRMRPEDMIKTVPVDMELKLEELTTPFLKELEMLEPHGAGNPRPVFMSRDLHMKTQPVRLTPQTTQFYVTDGAYVYEAQWTEKLRGEGFGDEEDPIKALQKGKRFDLSYSLKIKSWEGRERVVLEAKEIKPQL